MIYIVTSGGKYSDTYSRNISKKVLDFISNIHYFNCHLIKNGACNFKGPGQISFNVSVVEDDDENYRYNYVVIKEYKINSFEIQIPPELISECVPKSGLNEAFLLSDTHHEINILTGIGFDQISLSDACSIIGKDLKSVKSMLEQPNAIEEMQILRASLTDTLFGNGDVTCDLKGFIAWAFMMQRHASKNLKAKPLAREDEDDLSWEEVK